MSAPINKGDRSDEHLISVFEKFKGPSGQDKKIQEVIGSHIGMMKEFFNVDFKNESHLIEFLKTTKISELNQKEQTTIEKLATQILGSSEESTDSSTSRMSDSEESDSASIVFSTSRSSDSEESESTSRVLSMSRSSDSEESESTDVEALKEINEKFDVKALARVAFLYENEVRKELKFPWDKGSCQLNITTEETDEPSDVVFNKDLISPSKRDLETLIKLEGTDLFVPNLFLVDHCQDRKNPYMNFTFSGDERNYKIIRKGDVIKYVQSVESFLEKILGETTTDEEKSSLRNAIFVCSAQQTGNGFAFTYITQQNGIKAELSNHLNVNSIKIEPVFAKYEFAFVQDEEGKIIPNQFRLTAKFDVSTFTQINMNEIELGGTSFEKQERIRGALNQLGLGEICRGEIDGSFIVYLNEEKEIAVKDPKMTCSLVTPPIRDAARAGKLMNEILSKQEEKQIKTDVEKYRQFMRQELKFDSGSKERLLTNVSKEITSDRFLSIKEDTIEEGVKFAEQMIKGHYANYINQILAKVNEDSFKTYLDDSKFTITDMGNHRYNISIQSIYDTRKDISAYFEEEDQERASDAQEILKIGSILTGKAIANFSVTFEDPTAPVISDFSVSYIASLDEAEKGLGSQQDKFASAKKFADAQTLVEQALEYDKSNPSMKSIEQVKKISEDFRQIFQTKLRLIPNKDYVLKTEVNSKALQPEPSVEREAHNLFAEDIENGRIFSSDTTFHFSSSKEKSFQIKTKQDVSEFKKSIDSFVDKVQSTDTVGKRIHNAVELFSSQHTQTALCGPYKFFINKIIMDADSSKFGLVKTEITKVDISFIQLKNDRFQIQFKARCSTMCPIEFDRTKTDETAFLEAREICEIGPIASGDVSARVDVRISENGIKTKILESQYVMRLT